MLYEVITDLLTQFWSTPELVANFLIFVNIFGAFLLGLLVGYERYYQGRAAGMRTYGLVCMASAAVTAICGYSGFWFGAETNLPGVEPTRVIQGIVTGIGFLGAGVILREGMNITGVITSYSIHYTKLYDFLATSRHSGTKSVKV